MGISPTIQANEHRATNLFQSGIEEQLVMSRTGHRSTAVRNYKRPSQEQLSAVSMALNPPKLGSEENECAAEFEANNSKLPKLIQCAPQ